MCLIFLLNLNCGVSIKEHILCEMEKAELIETEE